MQLTEQQAIAVAKFPAALQDLIATELSAGNAIAEIGSGFPAPPIGAWLKLARPITTRPGSSDARLDFRERNNSLYSSEITDQTRLFFVLEPPKPPASLSEEPTTCPATRSEEVTTASSQSRPTKRSLFVTIVGCLAIVAGALASTISFMSVLMLLAGGHGTAAGLTPEGILLILLPPATLAAGIGFVLRQRWAYLFVLILLSTSFAISAHRLLKGPIPRTTYISASGVTTTILPSTGTESIPVIIVSGGLLATLLARRIRSEFGWARSTPAAPCPTQEWRVGHI
ncbi:MAG: hypothetical protein R3F19_35465, partial [Verrucomicrobiales bacterium]